MKVKKLDEIKGLRIKKKKRRKNHKRKIAKEASEIEKDKIYPYFLIS